MSDNTLTTQDLELLKKPFQPRDHEFHRGFAYIAEEAVTSRLDEVDPGWQFKIISIVNREKQVAATAELTVKGVTRANVGMQVIEYVKDKGVPTEREAGEAEKAAATDALKRCARLFGVGRYLLDAPKNISTVDELGKWLVANYAKPAQNVTTLPPATPAQPMFNGTAALQPQPVEPPQPKPELTVIRGNGNPQSALTEPVDWKNPSVFFKRVSDMGLPTEGIVGKIEPGKKAPGEITLEWAEVESRLMTLKGEQKPESTGYPRPAYNWAAVWKAAQELDFDFEHERHFKNWLVKRREAGEVTDATTTDQLIELARRYESKDKKRGRHTAETETEKKWYQDALENEPRNTHTAVFHSIKYLKSANRWIFIGGKANDREISEFGDGFWTLANTLDVAWTTFFRGIETAGLDVVYPFKDAQLETLEIKWQFNKNKYPAAKMLIPLDDANIPF